MFGTISRIRFTRILNQNKNKRIFYRSKHNSFQQIQNSGYNRNYKNYKNFIFTFGICSSISTFTCFKLYNAKDNEDSNSPRNLCDCPHRIFSKFASVKGENGEPLMTTADFLRAITPYESLNNFDMSTYENELKELVSSVDLDGNGYIDFIEFIFFTTLLSIPKQKTKIAFRLFDSDSSGKIDIQEFTDMIKLVVHSNPLVGKTKIFDDKFLLNFPEFFGEDGSKELTFDEFNSFILKLRDAVEFIQFKMMAGNNNNISGYDYAKCLTSYSISKNKNNNQSYSHIEILKESNITITLQEYKAFLRVLESLEEIDFLLKSLSGIGEPFSKEQLKLAAKAVTNTELSDDILQVIFYVFDKNGDGKLDYSEFIGTLQGTQQFGYAKTKDSGVIRIGKCMKYCWDEEISDRMAKQLP